MTDFVNIFNILLNFNPTNNFKAFLDFRFSFVDVNADVSFDSNYSFIELTNNLKAEINGSNENDIHIHIFVSD